MLVSLKKNSLSLTIVVALQRNLLDSEQFISSCITEENDTLLSASLKRKFIITKQRQYVDKCMAEYNVFISTPIPGTLGK